MERFLALPASDRDVAFQQAAAVRGLALGSVEKDFWVCLMLRELFALPEIGKHLTFKGGTSLSKAWGLIDRFSEDIDLTIDRERFGFGGDLAPDAAGSTTQRQKRLQALKQACRDLIAGEIKPGLEGRLAGLLSAGESWTLTADADDPDAQTLLFAYPRLVVAATPSYVKPVVKLEFGARSDPWPVEERAVTPIVAEEFPQLFDATASRIRALRPERTFWEKVMLLHEERFRPAEKIRRPRMARHYYDVWRLIEAGVAATAAADLELFHKVAAHRVVYFKQNWVDYDTLAQGSIQMEPTAEQFGNWQRDYAAMASEMFVTTPPPFEDLMAAILAFQTEFNRA